MEKSMRWKVIMFVLLSITWAAGPVVASPPLPDNSAINARDTKGTLTPEDQSNKEADIKLTQRIRQAITDDKMLSVNAKNIKIITIDGVVTLRGPVKSEDEKTRIISLAKQAAGEAKINNQLEVTGAK